MSQKTKRIELRTVEGNVIFTGFLVEEDVLPTGEKPAQSSKAPAPKTKELMTDAQKRYLFRILAEQGIEGDAAHEKLKKLFGVASMKNVTKNEARKIIQQLLENKGGESDGSPLQ